MLHTPEGGLVNFYGGGGVFMISLIAVDRPGDGTLTSYNNNDQAARGEQVLWVNLMYLAGCKYSQCLSEQLGATTFKLTFLLCYF